MADITAPPPANTKETPAESATPPKKKHRLLKGVLVGAFALAVGALALDDLALRVENNLLVSAVVEQNEVVNQQHQENTVLKLLLNKAGVVIEGLSEENQILKEELGIEQPESQDSGPAIRAPQDNTRLLQVKAISARPSI